MVLTEVCNLVLTSGPDSDQAFIPTTDGNAGTFNFGMSAPKRCTLGFSHLFSAALAEFALHLASLQYLGNVASVYDPVRCPE